MRTHWFSAICVAVLLCCACTGPLAQTAPLPEAGEGTTALPVETPATATTTPPEEDPSVTPPPTTTATLPASAKSGSLMIRRGAKELEVRMSYSHFSKSTLFIDGVSLPVGVIGTLGVERMRRDLLITQVAGRYGLRDNLQAELRVPFRGQLERREVPEVEADDSDDVVSGFGIGDVEGALYYQLPQKSPEQIRWIVNVGVKSATGRDIFEIDSDTDVPLGTGFWSTKLGISGVKVSDPAAVYWNFGYTYNWLRKNVRIVGEDPQTGDPVVSYSDLKPGNTFDVGGGVAYALNPRLSVNTGVSISFNGPTTQNDVRLSNTAITSATLRLGAVWVTEAKRPIDISVSMGLTDDSPDFTLEARQNFKW